MNILVSNKQDKKNEGRQKKKYMTTLETNNVYTFKSNDFSQLNHSEQEEEEEKVSSSEQIEE